MRCFSPQKLLTNGRYRTSFSIFCFSCIPDNKEFHSPSIGKDQPLLYCILPNAGERVSSLFNCIAHTGGKTFQYFSRYRVHQLWKWWQQLVVENLKNIFCAVIRKGMLRYGRYQIFLLITSKSCIWVKLRQNVCPI